MALAVTEVVAEINSTAQASTYASGSFTPTAGAHLTIMAAVTASLTGPGAVTGGGLTWTPQGTPLGFGPGGAWSLYCFTAVVGGSPSPMTVTVDVGGDPGTGCIGFIWQTTGQHASSWLVQHVKTDFGSTAANPVMTLSQAMNTNNAYLAFISQGNRTPIACSVTGAGGVAWTEIGDVGNTSPTHGAAAYFRVGGETGSTLTFTTASASNGFGAGFLEIAPAATGSTGDLSKTIDALTVSAAGVVDVNGALSKTLDAFTSSAAGSVSVNGASSLTLGALTVSAAGITVVEVLGEFSQTLGALTVGGTGTVAVSGAAGLTLGALTSTATGTVAIAGSASFTLGALTTSAAGSVAVAGSLSTTLGALTTSAAGSIAVAGTSSTTTGALTTTATGSVAVLGAASNTLGALTLAASGSVDSVPVTGDAAITLGALTTSAAGLVTVVGSASDTLGSITCTAAGSVEVVGAATPQLGALAVSTAGSVALSGALDRTLGAFTATGAGSVAIAGEASWTLGALAVSATAEVFTPLFGSADFVLAKLTLSAAGFHGIVIPDSSSSVERRGYSAAAVTGASSSIVASHARARSTQSAERKP